MSLKSAMKNVPLVVSAVRGARRAKNAISTLGSPFVRHFPGGHFYSPLPGKEDVAFNRSHVFLDPRSGGVDLNEDVQLGLLESMSGFYEGIPFEEEKADGLLYYYDNDFFRYSDAIVLYGIISVFRPSKIIEVGSGFSSAVMMDIQNYNNDCDIDLVFIDPYADRLKSVISDASVTNVSIIESGVQYVDIDLFSGLNEDDILFIDSSHVVKAGSDVKYIFSDIIPILKKGVLVHIHDIMWPFEYPDEWTDVGTAWNESYFVRSFLQYNDSFEIVYFNSFMNQEHRGAVGSKMPLCLKDDGGSLWLRRVRD